MASHQTSMPCTDENSLGNADKKHEQDLSKDKELIYCQKKMSQVKLRGSRRKPVSLDVLKLADIDAKLLYAQAESKAQSNLAQENLKERT